METSNNTAKIFQVAVVVNRYDVIQSVSSSWQKIAEQGGAAESLALDKVIGRDLSVFISSDTTRMYIEACLKVCRIKQLILFREYRCDSFSHQRFMELQLTPLEDSAVEMKHFLLREIPFKTHVSLKDVSKEKPASGTPAKFSFVRCSMCNSLKKVGEDQWVFPENLSQRLAEATPVIHSVCPSCLDKIWQQRAKPD